MAGLTVLNIAGHAGEQDFDAFYREYYPLVYRTAYSVTHNRQDAEDVLQTVFLNVLRRDDPNELPANVKGYLYRAAVREALHLVRARARQAVVHNLESVERAAREAESVLEDETRASLLDAIATLRREDVELLALRYIHGRRDAEIATMLGCSRVKVAVGLYRARAQLKRLLNATPSTVSEGISRRGALGLRLSEEGELR